MSNTVPPDSFPDPYEKLPVEQQHRTSVVTDKRIWSIINSCRGHRGTLQTTINILLHKLHEQLERNSLNSFCPREYEYAILNARLELAVLPRSAEPTPAPETVDRDDGRGTPEVARGAKGRGHKSTDARGASAHGGTQVDLNKA